MKLKNTSVRSFARSRLIVASGTPFQPNGSMNANVGASVRPRLSSQSRMPVAVSSNVPFSVMTLMLSG